MKSTKTAAVHIVDKVVGDQNIANLFSGIYSKLYNCLNDEEVFQNQEEINLAVQSKCAVDLCESPNCHIISPDMVFKAINKLNMHKKDGIYKLDTNNFIHGDGQLHYLLSKIFQSMLTHGVCNIKLFQSMKEQI